MLRFLDTAMSAEVFPVFVFTINVVVFKELTEVQRETDVNGVPKMAS